MRPLLKCVLALVVGAVRPLASAIAAPVRPERLGDTAGFLEGQTEIAIGLSVVPVQLDGRLEQLDGPRVFATAISRLAFRVEPPSITRDRHRREHGSRDRSNACARLAFQRVSGLRSACVYATILEIALMSLISPSSEIANTVHMLPI